MKKVVLMVPCYNEEIGIKQVISEVPKEKLKKLNFDISVLVIENKCTDKTAEVAKKMGAKVISEKNPGKGNAIMAGFKNIPKNTDFVVMLDGDGTYKPREIYRMIEPLENNFCDVVVGSRLEGKMKGKAMSQSHRLANWFFTFITRRFYGANVTDTCTGYFAWKMDVIKNLNGHIKSKGFAIEAEMITKMAKLGYNIYSVPITYEKREGDSKLSPIMDGIKITKMLLQNIAWKPGK